MIGVARTALMKSMETSAEVFILEGGSRARFPGSLLTLYFHFEYISTYSSKIC